MIPTQMKQEALPLKLIFNLGLQFEKKENRDILGIILTLNDVFWVTS